jgi:2-keto-3-deoxy-L-rhamnonate aldolase RhmA
MAEPGSRPPPSSFRNRLAAREQLTGTFIKAPTPHTIEIVGTLGFELVSIDEEHAPCIGRGDLMVALGAAANDAPPVKAAVDAVMAAAKRAQKPVCWIVGSAAEAKGFKALGASAFIVSSDQGFLRKIAGQTLAEMAALGR